MQPQAVQGSTHTGGQVKDDDVGVDDIRVQLNARDAGQALSQQLRIGMVFMQTLWHVMQ